MVIGNTTELKIAGNQIIKAVDNSHTHKKISDVSTAFYISILIARKRFINSK